MSKFFALMTTFLGATLIAMGMSLAADQCSVTAEGLLPCAEGKAALKAEQESPNLLHNASYHPRRGRHYPPPFPPYYPPPAPFCYTRSGFCRMVVATPPGTYCTCNFGYYWDSGVTGY